VNSRIQRLRRSILREPHRLALAAVAVAALALRLYGIDWDQGNLLHPDELHVVNTATLQVRLPLPLDWGNLLDPDSSTLNPRSIDPASGEHANYAYGALPLLVADLSGWLLTQVTGNNWQSYDDGLRLVGRTLSAVFDTLTVLLVFFLGARLGGRTAGLIGGALYATAPAAIQLAHFFTTDAWLAFFVTLTLSLAIRAAEWGTPVTFCAAGAGFGLALATKASVPALALPILAALAWDGWERRVLGASPRQIGLAALERGLSAGLWAFVAFALFEPYALLSPGVYLDQLAEQARIVSGSFDVPFTRQYAGTTPVVYQLTQLLAWGLGPVAGLLSLAGAGSLLVRAVRRPEPATVVLGTWLVVQGLVVLAPETKFMRYLAPLLPVMAAAAGCVAYRSVGFVLGRAGRWPTSAAVAAGLAGVAVWTAAFSSIYASPNPRVAASVWMYDHIPAGSRISAEVWDLAMPVALAQALTPSQFLYERVEMNIYGDRPPAQVADEIYGYLERADYVVIASNRLTTAVARLPWRYPVQSEYYRRLERGDLGFVRVADFRRDPGIGPLRWDDQWADESYLNYDHPRVQIFQKRELVARETYDRLMAPAVERGAEPTRHRQQRSLLLDEPVGQLPAVDNGRWSGRWTDNSLVALAVWLVLLAGLQYTGAPFAALLLRRAPDQGGGFARLIALLLAGYLIWLPVSLRLISFRSAWVGVGLAMVLAAGMWLRRRLGIPMLPRRPVRPGPEVAFWSAFGLFLLFRWLNPDSWHPLWGGEKPMEFAHLNAILRSAHFPPYDPWFSDGYLNYYYYGTYLIAVIVKATGIPSEIAFNLAQPTVIGMIAAGAWSASSALVAGLAGRRHAALGGAIGSLAVVAAGNLAALVRLASDFPASGELDFFVWTWQPSRAITGGITEFPYFTGLYADLHAHVVAWPMTLLLIALGFEHARSSRALLLSLSGGAGSVRHAAPIAARLAFTALLVGSLAATNAWDVPVYVALLAVAFWLSTATIDWWAMRFALTLAMLASIGLAGFVGFLPFFNRYVALFGSLERTRSATDLAEFGVHLGGWIAVIVAGLVAVQAVRWRGGGPTLLADPLAIAGLFVAGGVAAFAPAFSDGDLGRVARVLLVLGAATVAVTTFIPAIVAATGMTRGLAAALAWVLIVGAAVALSAGKPVLALSAVVAVAGGLLFVTAPTTAGRYLGAMIAAAGSVAAGVEIVFLVDDLAPDPVWYRMNTIFKFYNQVWILLSLSAAVFAAFALARLWSTGQRDNHLDRVGSGWLRAVVALMGFAMAAGLLYPVTATKPRLEQRFEGHPGPSTLDALDWMRYGTLENRSGQEIVFADDLAAIRWFNDAVPGSPVIAEASIGPYRGNGSRFSIATGLPTILGWQRHEEQQRHREQLPQRAADVRELYDSADPAVKEEILRRYAVEYIIVGDVERLTDVGGAPYAAAEGIAAFDRMVGTVLEIAFQQGGTTVYRVLPPGASSESTVS
jgi:YYY domain-containing protein